MTTKATQHVVSALKLPTEQASTSGTAIDFTGIPAGTKQVIISFRSVSTNGASAYLVQLGDSGGFENTGYLGATTAIDTTTLQNTTQYSDGFNYNSSIGAGNLHSGQMILTRQNETHRWSESHSVGLDSATSTRLGGGNKDLSAELTQVRITTASGDTFDSGAVNIAYN